MSKRTQNIAAAALGVIALLMLAAAALLYGAGGRFAPARLAPAALAEPREYGLVSINDAEAEELEALPGIGPVLAARIVEYRAQNGPFRGPEDLTAVPGIGAATAGKLTPFLTYDHENGE